ncbi:MAG TPA: YqiA/YcfP family alpha/beta fold hydrolase [Burkholderiaceae bacterium]|nr:YqiA/YcfP family alpha/beta fold hydrolase [Burkholderiaceae bacterium]
MKTRSPWVVYLHGFRSSPQSFKAQVLAKAMAHRGLAERYHAPALPASPRAAVELVEAWCAKAAPEDVTLIGSSLGGYYATWLAERIGCRAVLINPGVFAARDLSAYVGTHASWHDPTQTFELTPQHIDELRAIEVAAITRPDRYYLIAATGDEVLDWREMVAKYPLARHTIVQGSDHGLSDFERYLDDVLAFCGV